jgi:hypothetical protein
MKVLDKSENIILQLQKNMKFVRIDPNSNFYIFEIDFTQEGLDAFLDYCYSLKDKS